MKAVLFAALVPLLAGPVARPDDPPKVKETTTHETGPAVLDGKPTVLPLKPVGQAAEQAAEPPRISGPDAVAEHKLVRMSATGIPVGFFILWDVYPPDHTDAATQRLKSQYEFTGPPGTYKVRVRAFRMDSEVPLEAWKTVTIGGTAPAPPGPTPPGPQPPAPTPLDALGQASRDGAAKVTSANKAAEAKALAAAQRTLASTLAAGGIANDPAKILVAWREANNAAAPKDAWTPWGQTVSAALQAQHKAGKLPDKAAWVAAFNSLATGLE